MLKILTLLYIFFLAFYLQQGQPKLHIGEDDIDGLTTSPLQHFVLLSLGQLVIIYTMK